jgi:hypothetical protein
MWATILDSLFLTLGAAAALDLSIGLASGVLQLGHADRTLAPPLFRRCMLGEAALTAGSVAWFGFVAAL